MPVRTTGEEGGRLSVFHFFLVPFFGIFYGPAKKRTALGGAGTPRRHKADSHAPVAGCGPHPATGAEGDYRRIPIVAACLSWISQFL